MTIALHTFVSIKDVCLHRTPFCHLLITRKNIPSGENAICQNGQVKVRKIIVVNIIFHTYFVLQLVFSKRLCLIWMIIRSSGSTISFSVVVKVPASHPSDPGSIPASMIFYNFFYLFFFFFFFLLFFYLGFKACQDYFTHFEPNRKLGRRTPRKQMGQGGATNPDHPRVERLVSHVIIGSNPQRWDVFNFLFAIWILCNLSGWQISCQNVNFHNRCDHKDISSEKTLYSGVGMSRVCLSQGLCTCQLQLRPIGLEKAKIYQGFLPIKEVIKTDNSNQTSTPSTFVAETINVLRCYRHTMRTGSLHYSFLSFFLSLQMNEVLKVELQFISSQCALDIFHYCRKSRSPSHNFFVLKHVTLQILDFIPVI